MAFKTLLLTLTCALLLASCGGPDPASITELREYEINGTSKVVGVGEWDNEGCFHIQSYDGQKWGAGKDAEILEGPVTLESFNNVTK
jgi:hypothetical protein